MDTMTRLLILTVRTFSALTRTKNVSLLTPSIFAACGMDTPIGGKHSVRSFFGFSGGVLIGIRMPVFELIGIVIIDCTLPVCEVQNGTRWEWVDIVALPDFEPVTKVTNVSWALI